MFIEMPSSFPKDKFQQFGLLSAEVFPAPWSDEDLNDPLQRRQHSDRSYMAVCYRYRTCTECNEEFKALLANAPDSWREWNHHPELAYKLERCLYTFFMNGLSVFESLGFCLYFIGGAIRPSDFPDMGKPRRINLQSTSRAFTAAFPQTSITKGLAELPQKAEFSTIDEIRNILAHRLSGKRSLRSYGTYPNGPYTREDVWYITDAIELVFDEGLIQRLLDGITNLLTALIAASLEFAENNKPAKAVPGAPTS